MLQILCTVTTPIDDSSTPRGANSLGLTSPETDDRSDDDDDDDDDGDDGVVVHVAQSSAALHKLNDVFMCSWEDYIIVLLFIAQKNEVFVCSCEEIYIDHFTAISVHCTN